MHWILLGCGYTGARLAARLVADGHAVTATRRSAFTLAGVDARVADLGDPTSLAGLQDVAVDAIVVVLAPPGAAPHAELAAVIAATVGARRYVYVSSTGVYGPGHGAWVDETWPLAPITPSGRARVAAEMALAAQLPAEQRVILRPAGIYGPGRGIAERIRGGTYRIVGDGTAHISRIHVDDLVEAIVRAGTTAITGVINCADDAPDPIGEVADTVAAALGLPSPPRQDPATVAPEIAGMLTADRRIANRRLREDLGVTLRFPSWRTGW